VLNIQAAKDEEITRIRAGLTAFATARTDLCMSFSVRMELADGVATAQKELDRIASEPSEAEERDKLQIEKLKKALACLDGVNTLAASLSLPWW
jgi:hypothetical protein